MPHSGGKCEECGNPGWKPYIRFIGGALGWLCKKHFKQFIKEGFLVPPP